MGKFLVDQRVFETLPNYCVGIVAAEGIDNKTTNDHIKEILTEEIHSFYDRMKGINIKDSALISPYREALRNVGINPNKFMCSIEALGKRLGTGKGLPSINPIVDLVNALSLKYVLPMGAHDIDNLSKGELRVRFSVKEDLFLPMGECRKEMMPEGELIYASKNTVKTRRWIWRQSEDGKISSETKNVFFPVDGFVGENDESVKMAISGLETLLQDIFCCNTASGLVTSKNSIFNI